MKVRDEEADARMARSGGVLDYLPWILRYPVSGYALPVLLMITLFVTLGMKSHAMLPEGMPPDTGLPLLGITAAWSVHYLMRVIQHSARGYATPPPMTGEVLFFTGSFRPLALPALMASGYYAWRGTHPLLAQGGVALGMFVMPAYLFVLATEEELLAAFNPFRWLQLMMTMGIPYLLPGIVIAAGTAGLLHISSAAGVSSLTALLCYLTFVTAHLLGYLGFRHHKSLGLHVEVRHPDEVANEREQVDRFDSLLVRIENCLQYQDEQGAAREIERAAGGPVSEPKFFEDLFNRMRARGTPLLLHAAGRRLITVMLAAQRPERAMEAAEICLNRNPHFEPQYAQQLEPLARQALAGKYFELFERLTRNAAQRHPGDAVVVSLEFLRAQYLAEHRNDETAALALL